MFDFSSTMDLPMIWGLLIATAILLYILLDGFDLGIGGGAWILGAALDLSGLTALYLTAAVLTLATLCLIPALAKQRRVALGEE